MPCRISAMVSGVEFRSSSRRTCVQLRKSTDGCGLMALLMMLVSRGWRVKDRPCALPHAVATGRDPPRQAGEQRSAAKIPPVFRWSSSTSILTADRVRSASGPPSASRRARVRSSSRSDSGAITSKRLFPSSARASHDNSWSPSSVRHWSQSASRSIVEHICHIWIPRMQMMGVAIRPYCTRSR